MRLQNTSLQKEFISVAPDKTRRILIVDSDDQFREGLYNFLLAAGYDDVDAAKTFSAALARIRKSAYEIIISELDSKFSEGLSFAQTVVKLNPRIKLIFMTRVDDQENWAEEAGLRGVQFLLKPTFPSNLLYLLRQ